MKTVEETRLGLFRVWVEEKAKDRESRGLDEFTGWELAIMYGAFKGALDAVVIDLPEPHFEFEGDTCGELFEGEVVSAINSTNLGLKIK